MAAIDSVAEEDLLMDDSFNLPGSDNLPGPELSPQYSPNNNAALLRSNSQTSADSEPLPWSPTSSMPPTTEICVVSS